MGLKSMTNEAAIKNKLDGGRTGETVASMGGNHAAGPNPPMPDVMSQTAEELSQTIQQLSEIVRHRTELAATYTQAAVRQNPWTSIALAGALGAIIAISIAPRKKTRVRRDDWQQYLPSTRMVSPYIPTELPSGKSLTGRLEGLLDTLTELDPKAVAAPAFRSAQEMFGMAREAFRSFSK